MAETDTALLERVLTSDKHLEVKILYLNTGDTVDAVGDEVWAERVLVDPSGSWVGLTSALPGTLFVDAEGGLRFAEAGLTPATARSNGILERYLTNISK